MLTIKKAQPEDLGLLRDFLQLVKLPHSDLPADLSGFSLAFDQGTLVGSAGIETLGPVGLLRSVAVAATHRNQGLGQQLFVEALKYARSKELRSVYLITNTAEGYFEKNGFQKVERDAAPTEVAHTEQFSALCPSSSVVMKMALD